MRERGAIVLRDPEILPISLPKEVQVRDAIRTRSSSQGRGLSSMESEIAVADKAPRMGGCVAAEGSNHLPKLLRIRLRATGVPRSVEGKNA
jgi:hypothetical protein